MMALVEALFGAVAPGQVPYWRLVLRGCSQLCFQTNELTALFFLAAVALASPIAAAYVLTAAVIAPGARMLLGERGPVLETGLPGLNPCLIALALPAFFHTGWTDAAMWGLLIVAVLSTVVLTRLLVAFLPLPTLALPFLITFWVIVALTPTLGFLHPIAFGVVAQTTLHPVEAVLRGLGEALFSPTIWSGLLVLGGILISNWRHGVLALLGAVIATVVAFYHRDLADPATINLGLYGFNGVLAAVAVFVCCGKMLRLAIFGAILATLLIPAIPNFGVSALSAPFVLATWLLVALGWVERNWFDLPSTRAMSAAPETESA